MSDKPGVILLLKSVQPRKTDSGTEPVSVGVVWLTKTRKSYIYHICYVHERSFYKIVHASEKAYRTLFDRTSSVSQYETRTFDSGQSAALKRFNQFLLRYQNLLLLRFCRNSITSDYLTSCERKTKHYKFTLVNKHEGTAWHFPVTVDLNGVEGIVCCEQRKVCRNYCREAAVRSFLRSDHNFAPFILWNQLVNSYLDDLLYSDLSAVGRSFYATGEICGGWRCASIAKKNYIAAWALTVIWTSDHHVA